MLFYKIFRGILTRPVIVLTAGALITLFFALQIPRLSFKTSIYDLVIEDLPETAAYKAFKEVFGSDDIIRVVVKSPNIFDPATFSRVEKIVGALSGIEGVRRIISLPGVKKDVDAAGNMSLDRFAAILAPVSLFQRNLLSADGKTTALTLVLSDEADKDAVIEAVERVLSAAPRELSLYQIGMPLVSKAMSEFARQDLLRLPPVTFAIIATLLFLLFRNLPCFLIPIACVGLCLIWTFGFIALTGIPLSIVTVIVPVFLIAVGTAYCLYICSEYLMHRKTAESADDAVFLTMSRIFLPTMLAVGTTMIGLGSLLVNRITAIREFALFSCFGMLCMLVAALILLPTVLSLISVSAGADRDHRKGILEKVLTGIVHLNLNRQRMTLSIMAGIAVFCLFGIFKIRVETNPVGFFKEDIPVSRHFHDIYKDLSGSFPVNVVVKSQAQDYFETAEHVAAVSRIQEFLETLPGIDKTISFADYLKLVNYASNRFDPAYYRIPEESFEVRMLLNSYRMLLGEDMLTPFMSSDMSSANILLMTHISSSEDFLHTRKKILEHAAQRFSDDLSVEVTGLGIVISQSSRLLTIGQVKSLSITLILIFGIMFALFLSWKVGLIAILPNLFPIVVNFGIMGWLGIELSMATSLIAGIAIGLAVDDTIHYMVHYNREFKKDLDDKRALRNTIMHMGRPMIFTTITIALGFSILAFSSFKPTAVFGILMVITMVSALMGDLLLLPSLLIHVELVTLWDLVRLKLGKEPTEGIPLFKGLSRTQVHYLIMAGSLKKIESGEVLMRKGEPSDSMYAVITGELDVIDPLMADDPGKSQTVHKHIHRLKKGDIVGEMGLIRSAPRSATVIASRSGELLQVNLKMIRRLQWLYPPIAQRFFFNLMTILCDRLENATHCLSEASLVDDVTFLYNQKGFLKILDTEIYRAGRFGEEISLLLIKVYFQAAGSPPNVEIKNTLMRRLSESLIRNARKSDTYGRLDAQTFALLMPKTTEEKARAVVDRISRLIDEIQNRKAGVSLRAELELVVPGSSGAVTGESLLEKAQRRFRADPGLLGY